MPTRFPIRNTMELQKLDEPQGGSPLSPKTKRISAAQAHQVVIGVVVRVEAYRHAEHPLPPPGVRRRDRHVSAGRVVLVELIQWRAPSIPRAQTKNARSKPSSSLSGMECCRGGPWPSSRQVGQTWLLAPISWLSLCLWIILSAASRFCS